MVISCDAQQPEVTSASEQEIKVQEEQVADFLAMVRENEPTQQS